VSLNREEKAAVVAEVSATIRAIAAARITAASNSAAVHTASGPPKNRSVNAAPAATTAAASATCGAPTGPGTAAPRPTANAAIPLQRCASRLSKGGAMHRSWSQISCVPFANWHAVREQGRSPPCRAVLLVQYEQRRGLLNTSQ
jgi:hypothetical protein